MKKRMGILLLGLALTLSACAPAGEKGTPEPTGAPEPAGTAAGTAAETYTGVGMGMKSEIQVSVELTDGAISDIQVLSAHDTAGIGEAAVAAFPRRILETQNLDADVVTGATMTCLGIKSAVSEALKSAGVDPETLRKGAQAVERTEAPAQQVDVVVGSGIAGLTAAIEVARKSGLSVLVVEKNGYTGGSSRVCGGGIWAVDSSINQTIGQDCPAEELIDFLRERGDGKPINEALLRNLYAGAGDIIEFLYADGLPVSLETWSLGHPDSQLPVLWSVHNEEHPWAAGESRLLDAVQASAEKLGVEIRLNTRMTAVRSENGVVTGIRVEDLESGYDIDAGKVILATGGFTRNPELIETYAPEYKDAFPFTGAGSTGDGILLTRELGAHVVGEGMMGLFGVNPGYGYYNSEGDLVWLPQLVVNREGEDFGLSQAFYSNTLQMLLDQTGSCGYGIFDSTTGVADRLEQALEKNVVKKFGSLEELAAGMGIDPDALKATAEEKGLAGGPYYAIVIRPLFIGSIPGLEVDENCRVLNEAGEPIENLLACGELIFGNMFAVRYPASGTGMGTSCYSGGLAARTAMAD